MSPLWCDGTINTGKIIILAIAGIAAIISLIEIKIQSDKDNKGK